MRISNRDKGLLLGFLGVLIAVACYWFVYDPATLRHQELEAELAKLKAHEAELQELVDNYDFYEEQIVVLTQRRDELVERFPAEVKPENEIMYAVELEDLLEVQFSALNYGAPIEIVPATNNAGLYAYNTPLVGNYTATYQGLKDIILHTAEQNDRMVVDSVTAAYDGITGNLIGNVTINMYAVSGTEKIYQAPYVPAMNMGIDNIFGTFEGFVQNIEN